MSEDREMTPEYALLSLRAAFLAGRIDECEGGSEFIDRVRLDSWNLSEAYLAGLIEEAVSLGLDEEYLLDGMKRMQLEVWTPEYIQFMIQFQGRHDAARNKGAAP